MKPYLWPIAVCLHVCSGLYANDFITTPDSRSLSLGGNGVTQSVLFNPALASVVSQQSIQIDYFNQYGMKELGHFSAALLSPNRWLPVGIHISSFGYDDYRENMLRLSVAKNLGQGWSLGAAIRYRFRQTALPEELPGYLSADVGVTFIPVTGLLLGLTVMDAPAFPLGNETEQAKVFNRYAVQLGFEWEPVHNLLLISALESRQETFAAQAGVEYAVEERFFIRSGIHTAPLRPSLGAGCTFRSFIVDVVAVFHPLLGVSSGIGVSFSF